MTPLTRALALRGYAFCVRSTRHRCPEQCCQDPSGGRRPPAYHIGLLQRGGIDRATVQRFSSEREIRQWLRTQPLLTELRVRALAEEPAYQQQAGRPGQVPGQPNISAIARETGLSRAGVKRILLRRS